MNTIKDIDLGNYHSIDDLKKVVEEEDQIMIAGKPEGVVTSVDSDIEVTKGWYEVHHSADGVAHDPITCGDGSDIAIKKFEETNEELFAKHLKGDNSNYKIKLVSFEQYGNIMEKGGKLVIHWYSDPIMETMDEYEHS